MKIIAAACANIRDVNPQPAWTEIRAERPDVVLLLGDTVYLHRDDHTAPEALAAELSALYGEQFAEPGFAGLLADLRARGGQLVAIYDDHDFLGNNRCGADSDAALRQAARAAFIKAFSPPLTGADVYRVHHLGLVDVVVLDARYYRASPAASRDDRDAILGAAQWNWFEHTIKTTTAKYLLVASSTTLHAFGDQSWEQYPAAFQRIAALLRGRPGALVVSGDVHRNAAYDESGVIEIVTSGVAHRSLAFGALRKNYGVFTFDDTAMNVALRSLKVGSRFDFRVPLARWVLP
jgi:phosphodiesterase/alkaline phosphatase D-like protein